MAPRRAAQEEEEEEERPTFSGPGCLTFNKPLSWRAGKSIATGELLKRLTTLATELREMDQEGVVRESFAHVAAELTGPNLLGHKDKGVRAYTACCLVDILKLCAPDAPFAGTGLKDLFTFYVTSIFPALSDPSHAYNTQHKYVLSSLAEVKSIVLVIDLPQPDDLILHIFSGFFDTISGSSSSSTGEQISKDVEFNMTQILIALVDEAHALPQGVIDMLIAQFLRASAPGGDGKKKLEHDETQSTLLPKDFPEAYNMAKTVCNSSPEKMARYISQYFNEVIMETSAGTSRDRRKSDAAAESEDDEPTNEEMQNLRKAHTVLRELWRACPGVLQNVLPQVEAELSAENVQLRLLATETLGDMISGIGSAGMPPPPKMDPAAYPPVKLEDLPLGPVSDSILTTPASPQSLAAAYPSVYHSFISRKNDKSTLIRAAWITAVGRILITSAGGIGLNGLDEKAFVFGLAEKLNDPDEKVRLAAIKVLGGFGLRDIMVRIAPSGGASQAGSVLYFLGDRCRDRKHAVRSEAMTVFCRMWGVAAGEILAGNESVVEALGSIPTRVLDAYYANDLEINVLMDHAMFEQFIPLAYPPTKSKGTRASLSNGESQTEGVRPVDADKIRTERILLFVNSLNEKSRKAFFALQARQTTFSKVVEMFLKRCEEFNGGVNDDPKAVKSKLDTTIKWFAGFLPDPLRVSHDLNKFCKMHDRRTYYLLRYTMQPANDFNSVHKAIKELQKKITQSSSAPAGLLDTLIPIIYRSASLMYNRSHQPVFLQYARTNEHSLGATANIIMQEISDKHPEIFQASVKELCKIVEENAPSEKKDNDPAVVDTLKSLASFAKSEKNKIPSDRKFIGALESFALYGRPPKVAKYAVSILNACADRKEMHMKDLLNKSFTDWEYGGDHFLTKLATICQIIFLAPAITEEYNDGILTIMGQLLGEVRTKKEDDDPSWQSDESMDQECQAKCLAVKILVTRLRVVDDPESARELSAPVFTLLNGLILKEGEISKEGNTPRHHKARLRLLAAQQLLKLCTTELYDKMLTPAAFNNLAFVAQDASEDIRSGFVEKLQKYLVKGHLSSRFLTIIFLTAFEPSSGFKNSIMTWIRSRVKVSHDSKHEQTKRLFESIFPRLLHLLAHHPDFSHDPSEMADHAKYILYYISTVASEDNLPLIYKFAQRVKQVRDAIPGVDGDNIYILSDLAQNLMQKWEEKKGWSMQTWPAKVPLPAGLFAALPNHDVAQKIAMKNYMPKQLDPLLDGLIREVERKKKRKSDDDADEPASSKPTKKHKSSKSSDTHKAKRPKSEPREKKTPKPKARRDIHTDDEEEEEVGTPAPDISAADRRRSGRGTSVKKAKGHIYKERGDSEDDEEMWDGVAKWEYFDKDGVKRQRHPPEDEKMDKDTAEVEEEGEEAEATEEEAEQEVEKEPTPTPPTSNGKHGKSKPKPATRPATKSKVPETAASPLPARTKSKAKAPLVQARKVSVSVPGSASPVAPRAANKGKAAAKKDNVPKAAAKGKGKGKAKEVVQEKSIYDMDLSD